MDGIHHTIAISYCPLKTIEEKLENQQKFCAGCRLHNQCEEKAKKCFGNLKENYLKPYTELVTFAKEFNMDFFQKSKSLIDKFKQLTKEKKE